MGGARLGQMPFLRCLLMSLAVLACGAWAQSAGPKPLLIDTAEECTALQGAWVGRGNWQRACQTPWGQDECLRLGAGWTPHVGAPLGGVCMARVSEAATGRQCIAAGGTWGPPGSRMPYCQAGTAAAKPVPVRKAADANKLCDSQRDCSYGCVYEGPKVADGADVMGRCRATSAAKGCFNMVEKGRLAGRICVD